MIGSVSSVSKRITLKVYCCIIIFLISFFTLLFLNSNDIYCSPGEALYNDTIDITAESALILNYRTGDILWEKNSDRQMYPASTTKMLSSIVAMENIDDFNEITEISKNASGRNHSAFRFRTGDMISLMDLLKAALICSHNNATIALAEYVSGSVEDFLKLMNEKAEELNAKNSFFQTTNGLDEDYPDHKSTAKDLALIASYCMKNDLFREIVSTKEDTIIKNGKEIEITNTNSLLSYNYIKGIKTGYTNNAGFCMTVYSDKDDLELITVVLNSTEDKREEDVLKLLDWAYDNLKYVKIVDSQKAAATATIGDKTELNLELYPEADYVDLVNVTEDEIEIRQNIESGINLPVTEKDLLGTIEVFINGSKIKELNLESRESLEESYIYQDLSSRNELQAKIAFIIALVFYFSVILFIIVRNLSTKK